MLVTANNEQVIDRFSADLELDEYEKYIDDLIHKVKASGRDKIAESIKVSSKLPLFLADPGVETIGTEYILTKAEHKLMNLTDVTNHLTNKELLNLIKNIENKFKNNIKPLIKTTLDKYKSEKDYINESSNQHNISKSPVEQFSDIRHELIGLIETFMFKNHINNSNEDFNYYSFF